MTIVILAGCSSLVRQQMDDRVARRIQSEGGVGERYCILCKEEDGKPNERAHDVVTIRPRAGGKPRRVAVCLAHAGSIGKPASSYEVVTEPIRGVSSRGSVLTKKYIQGKREKGEINRTLRRRGRYSRTQRGRLGE